MRRVKVAVVTIGGTQIRGFELVGHEMAIAESGAKLALAIPERNMTYASATFTSRLTAEGTESLVRFAKALEDASAMDDAAADAVLDASIVLFEGVGGSWMANRNALGDGEWFVRVSGEPVRFVAQRATAIVIAKGLSTGLLTRDEARAMAKQSYEGPFEGVE